MFKMIAKMERFKKLLLDEGIKPTYQRLKILEYMSDNKKNHPTVENIYEKLSKDIPTMSLTTVYNTMNTLLKKGLVSAVTITGTEARFDFNTGSHHHFLCKECGKIMDINIECPFSMGEKSVSGHRIDEVHGYFKGVCADCLARKSKKTNSMNLGPYLNPEGENPFSNTKMPKENRKK